MIVVSEDPDCKEPKAETAESRRKVTLHRTLSPHSQVVGGNCGRD